MPEPLTTLVVDWGGVLTGSMRDVVRAWADERDIDIDAYVAIMRDWFGEPLGVEARLNPIHALERGEMALPDFEARLAEALTERTGRPHDSVGLIEQMLGKFEHAPDMTGLVRRARQSGLRTGLLSNSWGGDYPRDGWDEMFDVVVISGEVGMRKPEPEIYRHALDLLGVPAAQAVFVDDLQANVAAAVAVGMVGVVHTSYAETLAELETLFGRALS